jgi:hypothetical protein
MLTCFAMCEPCCAAFLTLCDNVCQDALDQLEEHMQPFLEASPKDITAQVCRRCCCCSAAVLLLLLLLLLSADARR